MKARILTELSRVAAALSFCVAGTVWLTDGWAALGWVMCGFMLLDIFGTREQSRGRRESLFALAELDTSAESAKAWEDAVTPPEPNETVIAQGACYGGTTISGMGLTKPGSITP